MLKSIVSGLGGDLALQLDSQWAKEPPLKKKHPQEGVLTLGHIKEIFLFSIPLIDTIVFLPRITTPITVSTSHHEIAMTFVGYIHVSVFWLKKLKLFS